MSEEMEDSGCEENCSKCDELGNCPMAPGGELRQLADEINDLDKECIAFIRGDGLLTPDNMVLTNCEPSRKWIAPLEGYIEYIKAQQGDYN